MLRFHQAWIEIFGNKNGTCTRHCIHSILDIFAIIQCWIPAIYMACVLCNVLMSSRDGLTHAGGCVEVHVLLHTGAPASSGVVGIEERGSCLQTPMDTEEQLKWVPIKSIYLEPSSRAFIFRKFLFECPQKSHHRCICT